MTAARSFSHSEDSNPVLDDGVLRSVILPQADHWSNKWFLDTCRQIGYDPMVTGRLWEWVVVSLIMNALPSSSGCTALGVGVGEEPVIRLASDLFHPVMVTDLWSPAWRMSPHEWNSARAQPVVADATRLPLQDRSIDVLWSVSSIEHFHQTPAPFARLWRRIKRLLGTWGIATPWHRGPALKALAEIERVLRSDGIAIITTEIVISGRTPSEFFGFHEFLAMISRSRLRLVSDRCACHLDDYFLRHVLAHRAIRTWVDPLPHVYLDFDGTVFTPAVFVLAPAAVQVRARTEERQREPALSLGSSM